VTTVISPTLFREKTMKSILSGWKLSIAAMLLVSVLAFSVLITSVNARQYIVTFSQTGLDASATGTVVTVNDEAKTYADLPFIKWVERDTIIRYNYEDVVLSSVPGKRYILDNVDGPDSPIKVHDARTVRGRYDTQYYITVSSAHDGPTPSAWVDEGSDFTASVTSPTLDWMCTGFSVDGGAYQSGTSHTFIDVQQPHTIDFAWEMQP